MRTRLVLLAGASGSSKTTLGTTLKQELGYPLISKDHFKDALMNETPPANRAESKVIGRTSWTVLYAAIDALIDCVPGMIVDANFQSGFAEPQLRPRLERCDGIVIHCVADRDTILTRIRSRQDDPARHPGHFDLEAIPGMLKVLDAEGGWLDDLGVPVIEVDTTNGYRPGLDEILAAISRGSTTPT